MSDEPEVKTRVFISYARADVEFVDRLEKTLAENGTEPLVDRRNITDSERWWVRIEQLIASADAVVFVISPDAIASQMCEEEIAHAKSLNKRLAPIMWRVPEGQEIPRDLAELQYIFFNPPNAFDDALSRLVAALKGINSWERTHAELLDLAWKWAKRGRPKSDLLRGQSLTRAEQWLVKQPSESRKPAQLHLDFISASRDAASRRQRSVVFVSVAAALIALVLTAFAFWQRNVAQTNLEEAEYRELLLVSDKVRNQAPTLAARLAREAIRHRQRPEALEALFSSLDATGARRVSSFPDPAREIKTFAWNPFGKLLLLYEDGSVEIREAAGEAVVSLGDPAGARTVSAAWSPNGDRVATIDDGGAAAVWDLAGGRLSAFEVGDERPTLITWGPGGDQLRTFRSLRLRSWSLDGAELASASFRTEGQGWWPKPSPDLDRFAFVHPGGGWEASVWSTQGAKIVDLRPGKKMHSLAWGPGGERLILLLEDEPPVVWDLSGDPPRTLDHSGQRVNRASWSPNGQHIATGSNGSPLVKVLNENGSLAFTLVEAKANVLDWSRAGDQLLTGCSGTSSALCLWNMNGERRAVITGGSRGSLSPDGRYVLAVERLGEGAAVWQVSADMPTLLARHDRSIRRARWSPDGAHILTLSYDGIARLLDGFGRIRTKYTAPPETDDLYAAWSSNGDRIVTVAEHGQARIWDLDGKMLLAFGASLRGAWSARHATWSPDLKYVLSVDEGGLKIRDIEAGLVSDLAIAADPVADVSWSPDSKQLAALSSSGELIICGRDGSGALTLATLPPAYAETTIYWSPDSTKLLVLHGGEVVVWSSDGERLGALKDEMIDHAEWNPVGDRIVTTKRTGGTLWSVGGEKIATLKGAFHGVAWSPDGDAFLTVTTDKVSEVWDRSGQRIAVLTHGSRIHGGAWSPDGSRILTYSSDSTARIWDRTGKELVRIGGHGGQVSDGDWRPDGEFVLTVVGSTGRISPAMPLVDFADRYLPGSLTEVEREWNLRLADQ